MKLGCFALSKAGPTLYLTHDLLGDRGIRQCTPNSERLALTEQLFACDFVLLSHVPNDFCTIQLGEGLFELVSPHPKSLVHSSPVQSLSISFCLRRLGKACEKQSIQSRYPI
jgi:hypothetical protein